MSIIKKDNDDKNNINPSIAITSESGKNTLPDKNDVGKKKDDINKPISDDIEFTDNDQNNSSMNKAKKAVHSNPTNDWNPTENTFATLTIEERCGTHSVEAIQAGQLSDYTSQYYYKTGHVPKNNDVIDVLKKLSSVYADGTLTHAERQDQIDQIIRSGLRGNAKDTVQEIIDNTAENKLVHCRNLMDLLTRTIDRSIKSIEAKLEEIDFDPNTVERKESSMGSKVFLISHLSRSIIEQLEDSKDNIVITDIGGYTTVENVINIIRCTIFIDDVPVRLNLVDGASMQNKMEAHQNLKTAVTAIIEKCDSHNRIIEDGVAKILMTYRANILKYQAFEIVLDACKEIVTFLSEKHVYTDDDAFKAGFDLEHMDQVIKCLSDILSLI